MPYGFSPRHVNTIRLVEQIRIFEPKIPKILKLLNKMIITTKHRNENHALYVIQVVIDLRNKS